MLEHHHRSLCRTAEGTRHTEGCRKAGGPGVVSTGSFRPGGQAVEPHDAVPGAQHPQKPEVFKWKQSMDDFFHV